MPKLTACAMTVDDRSTMSARTTSPHPCRGIGRDRQVPEPTVVARDLCIDHGAPLCVDHRRELLAVGSERDDVSPCAASITVPAGSGSTSRALVAASARSSRAAPRRRCRRRRRARRPSRRGRRSSSSVRVRLRWRATRSSRSAGGVDVVGYRVTDLAQLRRERALEEIIHRASPFASVRAHARAATSRCRPDSRASPRSLRGSAGCSSARRRRGALLHRQPTERHEHHVAHRDVDRVGDERALVDRALVTRGDVLMTEVRLGEVGDGAGRGTRRTPTGHAASGAWPRRERRPPARGLPRGRDRR